MKKWFIFLIIFISTFIIRSNNVLAYTDNLDIQALGYSTINNFSNNSYALTLKPNASRAWKGREGWILFTFSYYSVGNVNTSNPIINGVSVYSGNEKFICDLGTVSGYTDNTTSYFLYTAKCPVQLTSNYGFSGIEIEKYYNGVGTIRFGGVVSFYDNASNLNSVITAINNSSSSITALLAEINGQDISRHTETLNHIDAILTAIQNNNNTQQQIQNNTEQIKNDIKSENVSGAEGSADDLKNNSAFQDNSGLSGVISMPLTFINSLTNSCQAISLTIPYMDEDLTIPCLQPIITNKMPLLANLIKIVINGFIVYRVLLDIFQIVRNAKNPEDDRIEVLDL